MKVILTSNQVPSSSAPDKEKGLPVVAGIVMAEQTGKGNVITARPVSCSNCGAVLTDPAEVRKDPALGLIFTCSYCGTVLTLNHLPDHLSPVMDFVIPRDSTKEDGNFADALVACVDISGSMGSPDLPAEVILQLQQGILPSIRDLKAPEGKSKLDAVKASLLMTLNDLLISSPETRFGLISFSDKVRIYVEPGREALTISEDAKLLSREAIEREVSSASIVPRPLKETAAGMQELIAALKVEGDTALGPALAAAFSILRGEARGRVILLTDGLANRGIGTMNRPSPEGKKFYENLAREMTEKGMICDIVALAGQGSMEIQTLMAMPSATGGDLFYTSVDELDATFESLGAAKYYGRNARLNVVTPSSVTVEDMSGANAAPSLPVRLLLGQVAEGRELYFRFAGSRESHQGETIPVQFQLEWTDREGNPRITVNTIHLHAVDKPGEGLSSFDPLPLTIMEVQKAGQDALSQGLDKSRERLLTLKEFLEKVHPMLPDKRENALKIVEEELEHIEEVQKWKDSNSFNDYRSVSSYSMSRRSSSSPPPKRRGIPAKLS